LERKVWDGKQEVGVGGCDAGGVVKGCDCAEGSWGGGSVRRASVVLGTTANSYVINGKAGGR